MADLANSKLLTIHGVPRALIYAAKIAALQRKTSLREFVIEEIRQAIIDQQEASEGTLLYQNPEDLQLPKLKPPIFRVVPNDYRGGRSK
jgi:hypothetical protein